MIWIRMFVLAFVIRIAIALGLGIANPPVSDEKEYYQCAVLISQGSGLSMIPQQSRDGIAYPTAYRMPGTSLVLGFSFLVFGDHYAVARITSILAASFSAPLMYAYTRQMASTRTAQLAGIACAVYPPWVYYSQNMLSESFFVPALLLALVATVTAPSRPAWMSLLAGVTWGVATMIRPHALPIAAMITPIMMWQYGWRRGLLLALGVTAAMLPWLCRNYAVFGRPVLATEGGETFLGSNNPFVVENPNLHGQWIAPVSVPQYRDHLAPIQDELERNREQYALGLEYLREHPEVIPALVFNKLARWLTPITVTGGTIRLLVLLSYGGLLVALVWGIWVGVFRWSLPLMLNFICTFVFMVLTAVYWGNLTRGRLPLEIIWIPWAAMAMQTPRRQEVEEG